MTTVRSVQGPVDLDPSGFVLPHEHLFLNLMRERRGDGLLHDPALMAAEVQRARDCGVVALVDCTPPVLGRDSDKLLTLAQASGLAVIAGSGFYRDPFLTDDPTLEESTHAQLARALLDEIEHGDAAGLLPGLIGEVGCDKWYVSPREERAVRACAIAARRSGLALTTHAARWPVGHALLDLCEQEDLDLEQVIIGHVDTVPVPGYAVSLAARGAFVQLDTIRGSSEYETDTRIALVRELLEAGFGDRVLLSHDVCLRSHLHANGGPGYTYIFEVFLPRLEKAGVDERQLLSLASTNPQRALRVRQPTGSVTEPREEMR